MVISPHPDDDVISAGALMDFMVRELGITVFSVYVTNGSDDLFIPTRRAEAKKACSILGSSPIFLDLVTSRFTLARRQYVHELTGLLTRLQPELVLLPASDCHPTHVAVRRLCEEALRDFQAGLDISPTALSYEFWSPIPEPGLFFGFGELAMKKKNEALGAHQSQLERTDFVRATRALNRWRALLAEEMIARGKGSRASGDTKRRTPEFAEAFSFERHATEAERCPVKEETGERGAKPQQYDIAVFGDIFLDTIISPIPYTEEEGTRLITTHRTPGGNAANFSLMANALGNRVLFMSFLGRDEPGQYLKKVFNGQRNIDFVYRHGSKNTPQTFALTYHDGKRQFLSDFGSNTEIHHSRFDVSLLWKARHLHRAGFFWLESMKTDDNLALLKSAKEKGLETSIDTGTPPESNFELFDEIRPLLSFVDIYFGNEKEVCGLADRKSVEEAARLLLTSGVGVVVVHGGLEGPSLYTRTREISVKAVPVTVENPVGAGDVFNAAFVSRHLGGSSLKECLEFANLAGAYHVAHRNNPYPSEDELLVFGKERS